MPDRRHFLRLCSAAACGAATAAASPVIPDLRMEPLFRISLAQWSLHRALKGKRKPTLDPMDFPGEARKLGFAGVEYVSTFYRRASAKVLTEELPARARDAGVQNLLIMVDGEGALGDPSASARAKAVENHVRWLETAQALGCHSIRVNAESRGTRTEQRDRAVEGLRALCERAAPFGLNVLVENHGGLSSDGSWLAEVMRTAAHPRLGTLPDFGNFRIAPGKEYDRYRGVRELMPFARAVSAKSKRFDASGDELETDYAKMLRIVADAGYRGWIGIEWEGEKPGEKEGIELTRRLLLRVRKRLEAEREGR